jgi:hypothetical protein
LSANKNRDIIRESVRSPAGVAELADATVSKTVEVPPCVGSSPTSGTIMDTDFDEKSVSDFIFIQRHIKAKQLCSRPYS